MIGYNSGMICRQFPHWLRLRFGLRTLLVIVAVFAAMLSWIAWQRSIMWERWRLLDRFPGTESLQAFAKDWPFDWRDWPESLKMVVELKLHGKTQYAIVSRLHGGPGFVRRLFGDEARWLIVLEGPFEREKDVYSRAFPEANVITASEVVDDESKLPPRNGSFIVVRREGE